MKEHTTAKTLALLAAGALLASCTADSPCTLPGNANTVIETACLPPAHEGTGTRTAVDPTEYTSGEIGVNWLPTDRIGVYGSTTANACFTNLSGQETNRTSFAGTLQDGEAPLHAYYPYTGTAGDDPTAVRGTLPLTQHYSTASRVLEGDWKVGTPQDGQPGKFTFEHVFAFLRLDVNAAGTAVAGERLLGVSLTIPGTQLGGDFTCDLATRATTFTPSGDDASCVTMEWTDQPLLSASTFHGYMSVAPVDGILGREVTVRLETSLHVITFTETLKADAFRPNTYYTVPLALSLYQDRWTMEDNPDAREENAEWVPGLQSRLACANTVFAIEGQPFMHKIRVPQDTKQTAHAVVPVKEGVVRAYNLPEGLEWNADRCLVQGTAPQAGDYDYSVEFTLGGTTYKEGIRLHVAATAADLLSPTPMMGWQTWNVLKDQIGYGILEKQLEGMKAKGLIDAGYRYFGVDDCWQLRNDNDNGHQIPDPAKFPAENGVNGMARMADLIHQYGLKAGIYSDCGTKTCAKYFASYGYEELHAQDYKDWGYDFLKEDWYYDLDMAPTGATSSTFVDGYSGLTSYWNTPTMAQQLYTRMGTALKSRGLMLYMCEWGLHDPWKWGAETGATCWRMSYDLRDGWWGAIGNSKNNDQNANGIGLHNTIVLMRNLWPYVGINRYNDADMICVGLRGAEGPAHECVYNQPDGLTSDEAETAFAMWCMWGSPILLGFDMTKDMESDAGLKHDLALIKNQELIAISQDPLGQGAEYVKTDGYVDYYMKDLANGDVAIAAVNLGENLPHSYEVSLADFEALDKSATYSARDLLGQKDAGTLSSSSSLKGTINKHGTFIVRLTKKQ